MSRYWITVTAVLGALLALFLLLEGVAPGLIDPAQLMSAAGPGAALTGVALLTVDVLLPVPSSLVMAANGALFGVALGTALSVVGSMGAALIGFGLGRRGGPLLARLLTASERAQADALLARWGWLAIMLTRPLPLLAETTALMAGASPMPWRHVTLAALGGILPTALLYALAGAVAADFGNTLLAFALILLLAAASWLVGRWASR
jgi:uncharacterized membrane protein YdjX (TVP38/TMEM64 family)